MTECEHKTGTVLLNVPEVQITQCNYGCGAILVSTPMVDYEVKLDLPELAALRERVRELEKDVDAAIAGHLDYSYCPKCDEMRYFEVRVADGTFDGDTSFRCRVCGQTDEANA